MSNGYVTSFVAMVVGVATAFVMSRLLSDQSAAVREPIAQGVALFAAWLSAWPWMKRQPRFTESSRFRLLNRVRQTGFVGYAVWMAIGVSVIMAVRLYFQTG